MTQTFHDFLFNYPQPAKVQQFFNAQNFKKVGERKVNIRYRCVTNNRQKMSKTASATKAMNDAILQKIQQQQEELDKRDVLLREEEFTMQHLRKLKDDLMIASAQLSKREEKVTEHESRLLIHKTEENGLKHTQMELEMAAVRSTVNDILVSNYVRNVEESIRIALDELERRSVTVMEMEGKMMEERRLLNEEQAKFAQQQADFDVHVSNEREFLKKTREQIAHDQEKIAVALAEEKSRDEEREVYNKIIHEMEMGDERSRRHLKALEDDLEIRRLKLDVEFDELRRNTAELQHQDALYKTAMEQLQQDVAQLKAEKLNMDAMLTRLNDREQSLNDKAEELEKMDAHIRHERSKLFREQQTLNDSIAQNETLKREAEIDGMRNEAIATKTLQLKQEVDKANEQLEDREAYLSAWETELTNREEEYSRLVEQAISIPKLHQSSSEYQNVSSGVVKVQARRLKEHYLSGQQRRVFSASLKRGASTTSGSDNAYKVALRSMGITTATNSAASGSKGVGGAASRTASNQAATQSTTTRQPQPQTNLNETNLVISQQDDDDDEYNAIRQDDGSDHDDDHDDDDNGNIKKGADDTNLYGDDEFETPVVTPEKKEKNSKKKRREDKKKKRKTSRSSSVSDRSDASRGSSRSPSSAASSSSKRSSSAASSYHSSSAASASSSRSNSIEKSRRNESEKEEKKKNDTNATSNSNKPVKQSSDRPPASATIPNRRMLLPPMNSASSSQQQQQQASQSSTTSAPLINVMALSSPSPAPQQQQQQSTTTAKPSAQTRFQSAGIKKSNAATEASLATSSRICSLAHTVSELQKAFRRYAARANLLISDRNEEQTDRFYQRVTPSQRTSIETAIWAERFTARDVGIRRHFSCCPVVVEKEFTSSPAEMMKKVTRWWITVEESLQHSDERTLQERMELLDKAVEALSQALEKSDDIDQTGSKGGGGRGGQGGSDVNDAHDDNNDGRGSASAVDDGVDYGGEGKRNTATASRVPSAAAAGGYGGGGIAAATLSARRAMKHQQRPATAGAATASRLNQNNREVHSTSAVLL